MLAAFGGEGGLEVLDLAALAVVVAAHGEHDALGLGAGRVEQLDRLPEHLVGRIVERLPSAVIVERDRALAVDGDDDVGRALQQSFEVDSWERHERSEWRLGEHGAHTLEGALLRLNEAC